ncbi:MAG: hypothetical protein ACYCT1_12930 [Steroidobacteraceae bacterium]
MRKIGTTLAAAASASLLANVALASYMPAIGTPVIGAQSYGQDLVERVTAAHHNVAALTIYITLPGAAAAESIASTRGAVGRPLPPAAAVVQRTWRARFSYRAGQLHAIVPLLDVSNHRVGVMTLELKGSSRPVLEREALAIRAYLKRNTSFATNLAQKALWDPNLPLNSYAQKLVDETLARHPNVLIMAIHAATPKNATPEILGSNIGRIGKKDDSDDARVVNEGKTNLENNTDLHRFEVELPLEDAAGKRIGALGVVFPLTRSTDEKALHAEAIRIRDALARQIPSAARLVEAVN